MAEKRQTLINARNERRMTQQAVADHLGISLRYYQDLEYSKTIGSIWVWDVLEDLFGVHQRELRVIQGTRLAQAESR